MGAPPMLASEAAGSCTATPVPESLAQADAGPSEAAGAEAPAHGIGFRMPGVREYNTPDLIKQLVPALPGCSVSMDQVACRWRSRAHGRILPQVGFGPSSGMTRKTSLEVCLDALWAQVSIARPEHAWVSAIPEDCWGGLLDEREERPRKYNRW